LLLRTVDIYRDDITFRDPRNAFSGLKNYKLIFWSLRFHGRIFFTKLYVEVRRIWQPQDGLICMRWTVHGIPRVPWEAEGTFDGISQYKLDSDGKIYEHAVDNVILRDPPMQGLGPLLAGLNLVRAPPQQAVPGAWVGRHVAAGGHVCGAWMGVGPVRTFKRTHSRTNGRYSRSEAVPCCMVGGLQSVRTAKLGAASCFQNVATCGCLHHLAGAVVVP
jgi:hypothetical protein